MRLRPLEEQVVVIIGCSSGIGREAALLISKRCRRIVLGGRDPASLAGLAMDARAAGAVVEVVGVDVADADAVEAVATLAVARFGRIDTWIQLAAVSVYAPFEATTPDEFRRVIEVNLLGQTYGAMAALPRLRAAGGGSLIEVSSAEAEVPLPYQAAYAASKHGMAGFLRTLRMELEAEGAPIAIVQVMPSGIDTPLFEHARTKLGVVPRPMAPVYDPSLPAKAIVHATEHPARDLYIGGAGFAAAMAFKVLPGVASRLIGQLARSGQRSARPKSADSPDNLFESRADGRSRGHHPGRRWSLVTWAQLHPAATRLVALAAALAAGLSVRLRAD